jgi:protoporphyrinogen IX oxidase
MILSDWAEIFNYINLNTSTLKALHLIGMVSWFAGLFYIVRLFIYHVEAQKRPELERKILQNQFSIMERRLLNGITTPALFFTTLFGIWLGFKIGIWNEFGSFPYFHLKAVFLFLLIAYHIHIIKIRKELLKGNIDKYSSKFLRFYNEIATLLLVLIIFAVVIKDLTSILRALTGFLVFFLILVVLFLKRLQGKK